MVTMTANSVTDSSSSALGSTLSTLPLNGWLGYAATVTTASSPGEILPMSVSSTSERTCTERRSAMVSSTVPPPTSLVGEEMTWPTSTWRDMMVPWIGARTSVSSSAMRAFSTATCERTTSALALAYSRILCSKSTSFRVRDLNSDSARSRCVLAMSRRAPAASSSASAWASELRGVRLSICTSNSLASTTLPVSAAICRISPLALDFNSTVVTGSIIPAACTATTMSRLTTSAMFQLRSSSCCAQPAVSSAAETAITAYLLDRVGLTVLLPEVVVARRCRWRSRRRANVFVVVHAGRYPLHA